MNVSDPYVFVLDTPFVEPVIGGLKRKAHFFDKE
jgi:hypothetical protein